MSLLSELLSKIKHPELSKEVPPGLRSTVSALKKKESTRRRLAIVMILAVVTVSAGFATVYLIEVYLKGGAGQIVSQKGMAVKQKKQQIEPSQAALNEKPHKEFFIENQKRTVETAKAIQPEKRSEEKGIREKAKDDIKPQKMPFKSKKDTPNKGSIFKKAKENEAPSSVDDAIKTEKLKPDTYEKDLYLYMAKNYEAKRDYSNALSSYKKVLSIEPKNYRVMNNIASILIQLNSYNEARVYLQMALDIRNDYVPGLINMGIVLARIGETQNAKDSFLRALALEPDNRDAILNIAIFYEKDGSYDKAREYYSRLKQMGDQHGDLGLERIKTVTSNK